MYKRTNYSFLKSIFFQDAFSWCQEKFNGGYIHDWTINENEWGAALDTYENAFQLPIEKLMLYVIAITGLSGRNNEEYYFNFTIFLWGCYFIFYCIVVCSNGCRDKIYPL